MMNPRAEKKQIKDLMTLTTDLFGYIDYDLTDLEISKEMLNFYFMSRYSNRWISPVMELLIEDGTIPTANWVTLGSYLNQLFKNKWDRLKSIVLLEYDPIHNYSDSMAESITDSDDKTTTLDSDGTKSKSNSGTESLFNTRTDSLRKTDNFIMGENYEKTGTKMDFNENNNAIYGLDADSDPANADFAYNSNSGSNKENNYGTTEKNETITNTGTVNNSSSNTRSDSESSTETLDSTEASERDFNRERSVTHIGNIGNLTTQQLLTQEIEFWQWNFIIQMLSDVADVLTLSIY